MDAFFVLSGFLITGILVDTRSRTDYFSNYYIRRALRIFPLYYLVLLALFILLHVSNGGSGVEYAQMHQWGSPAWFTVYLGNFRMAYKNAAPPVIAYAPLWSLQIEEQFYLLFPLAVRWMRLEHLSRLLWCLVLLSPALRVLFYLWDPNNPVLQYALLPCHMDGIALGALIAIRFRTGAWEVPKLRLAAFSVTLLSAALIGSLLSTPTWRHEAWSSPFNRVIGYSLSGWGCAGLVLLLIQLRGSPYTRFLRIAPVQYIAKISYGIYLLHQLAFRAVRWTGRFHVHLAPNGLLNVAFLFLVSIAMASASWHLLESPLVRLKDRLAPRHTPDRVAIGV